MKSIRFRLLAAALAVVLGSAIAKSQTADATPPPPMHGPGFVGFWAKALNLTDEQKTQMKAVMQKEHATLKPLKTQIHQMDEQLKQYEEGTYSEAKVQNLVSQQSQTMIELRVQEARIHNELFQLLTPDQQSQLKELEANREARMRQHAQTPPADSQE